MAWSGLARVAVVRSGVLVRGRPGSGRVWLGEARFQMLRLVIQNIGFRLIEFAENGPVLPLGFIALIHDRWQR